MSYHIRPGTPIHRIHSIRNPGSGRFIDIVVLNSDFTVDGDAGTGLVSGYSVAVDKVVEVRSTLDRDIAIAATVLPPLCTTL